MWSCYSVASPAPPPRAWRTWTGTPPPGNRWFRRGLHASALVVGILSIFIFLPQTKESNFRSTVCQTVIFYHTHLELVSPVGQAVHTLAGQGSGRDGAAARPTDLSPADQQGSLDTPIFVSWINVARFFVLSFVYKTIKQDPPANWKSWFLICWRFFFFLSIIKLTEASAALSLCHDWTNSPRSFVQPAKFHLPP